MNQEERKQKMNEFNERMKVLQAKMKDNADTAVIVGLEAKDVLSKKLDDAKSGLEAARENCRIASEKGKGKISSELLKAQMNFKVAKENMEERKEARNQEKLARYIDNQIEYAEQSIALAMYAAEEAKVAFLEAVEAQQEYDELYGEK